MAQFVEIEAEHTLEEYDAVAHLAPEVFALRQEAERLVPRLAGRTVWMVNSTSRGGGVAEMLPTQIALLRDLGVSTEWVVLETDEEPFFHLTKQVHNLIHGQGQPTLDDEARALFERVNRRNADEMRGRMKSGDVVIVHDPQPMPLASILREEIDGLVCVWRCHIGLDEDNPATDAAWEFLGPYGTAYDHAVFSAPEYIPEFLVGEATVIMPAIDPLSAKNHDMHVHRLVGTLANGGLAVSPGPRVSPPFPWLAQRLQSDGGWSPANAQDDIGLLSRPIVTQVSRWDRLKGWVPLMRAFARMKRRMFETDGMDPLQKRRLEIVRLVLAGPDPESIQDDPEGQEVLRELTETYLGFEPAVQHDIAFVTLPMRDRIQNALMVNALQRSASIVVQHSIREGFGLTIAEAMWKHVPILTNAKACGPRQQVRDRLDGRLIADPEDETALEHAILSMLADPEAREAWGRSAQRRVHHEFLVFSQIRKWLELLARLA